MNLTFDNLTVPLTTDEHGVILVTGTRVPLDTVVEAYEEGLSAEEIVHRFTSLPLPEVYQVIGYYLAHQSEVAAYLAEREIVKQKVQTENEARYNPQGIRERLLARQQNRSAQ